MLSHSEHPGLLQHLDVLRGRRQRDREGLRQLAHRALGLGEIAQHPPAGGIAQSVEDGVEVGCMLFNHVVEYACVADDCQPNG
jgi:hypothetical protein